jgi:hypothetical protein
MAGRVRQDRPAVCSFLMESLHILIAAFNKGSLDVPAGLFTGRTTFTLNGRSYESILGGSPDDPLIRLLARGVAGYRTAAKALQYAVPGAAALVDSLSEPDASGVRTASIRVEGHLRDSSEPFATRASVRLVSTDRQLASVDVSCPEDDLARIAASRLA